MRKIEQDGKVAVLYSPEFGAGWWSWNREHEQLIYEPLVVEWVLAGKPNDHLFVAINGHINSTYPGMYTGGMQNLEVMWLPIGTRFRINEYDGHERVVVYEEEEWHTA